MNGVAFKDLTHDDLCHDLAECKETIYVNVPLGSVWSHQLLKAYGRNQKETLPRADVLNVRPSFTRFCIDIFEVKHSRADLLSDIRSGKWRSYLPYCNRFYFAIKSGIAKKDDIPEEAGILVRGPKGWTTVRGAKPRDIGYDMDMLLALIFYHAKFLYRSTHREKIAFAHSWYKNKEREILLNKLFGKEVSRELAIIKSELEDMDEERPKYDNPNWKYSKQTTILKEKRNE